MQMPLARVRKAETSELALYTRSGKSPTRQNLFGNRFLVAVENADRTALLNTVQDGEQRWPLSLDACSLGTRFAEGMGGMRDGVTAFRLRAS